MVVSFLEPVFAAPGPYATVCADVTHTTENADTELDLHVRAVSERLTQQGAPEPVVEAVRSRLLEGTDDGEAGTSKGRAVVVASDGSVVLDQAVETLVIADDPGEDTLLVGGSPLELGEDQHDMDALGLHGEIVPADRALLAAALATSAGVVVVPRPAMPDDAPMAAVLRDTDAFTPSAS